MPPAVVAWCDREAGSASEEGTENKQRLPNPKSGVPPHNLMSPGLFIAQVLIGYHMKPVDLSEDFTVAASNVITTLAFGKEVSVLSPAVYFELLRTGDGL